MNKDLKEPFVSDELMQYLHDLKLTDIESALSKRPHTENYMYGFINGFSACIDWLGNINIRNRERL